MHFATGLKDVHLAFWVRVGLAWLRAHQQTARQSGGTISVRSAVMDTLRYGSRRLFNGLRRALGSVTDHQSVLVQGELVLLERD